MEAKKENQTEIVKIILPIVLTAFVSEYFGYKRGKNSIKVDVLQQTVLQETRDKNTVTVNVNITSPDKVTTKST